MSKSPPSPKHRNKFGRLQRPCRRSGATSIPEALRLAPGVEVARISAGKWSIGIRGFGSRLNRGVLVLMDGRSVYTTLLAGTYWEVQDTVMEDIGRIPWRNPAP
jgi:iron complex outermembrane receptor protein